MNTFYEHHKNSIRFQYRCFDRILLNGLIQPFQQEQRVVGFFGTYRDLYPVSRDVLREIATQFQNWVINRSKKWGAPILDAPEGRRDDFVLPYFTAAKPDQVGCILKAREPARIMTAIGTKKENRWHLELKQRWVNQYNFYINDSEWGRMFVRVCPYFPFSARVCLNQHHWIANRLKQQGIRFRQSTNAFASCADPKVLQEIADSLAAKDLSRCGRKWLAQLTPFFTERERKQAGVEHRLFFSQIEYCDNLIFSRRAAVDELSQRLLDANRTIGQPNKISVIFGRKVQKNHGGKLQTVIEDLDLPNPVIRSHYKSGFIKQYVRDNSNLRTEPATNNVTDYGVGKALEVPVEKPELTAPVRVPKDIAKIVDTAPPSGASGARSGVIGGATTGLPGGLLGGVLGGTGNVPPPPPPPAPVRVGGNVKQPKVVHIEQPKYPAEARRARVEGVVILEATVTAEGTVDKVKVISGPPMLTAAAVEALTHWKYEPTYLNGQAVPVIPTARISFSLSGTPR